MSEISAAAPAVSVAPVTASLRSEVLALRVLPDQERFVGRMPELLVAAESDPQSMPMAILAGPEAVGYYRLDATPGAVAERNFGPATIGLRAFFIDENHQGRGFAALAVPALFEDLRLRRPELRQVALTVNLRNDRARSLYERAGFKAEPDPYTGGSLGPQAVMLATL